MIIGHSKQKKIFQKMIATGDIPHALLFSGPERVGKKTLALDFISSLFQADQDIVSHPDFNFVSPEEGSIKIKQIRDLNWKLSLRPISSPWVGAVIDQAHQMTREAQNCFLKSLEEPKAESVLILVTEHPKFLLPTILSRCETIKFYPVQSTHIKEYLKKENLSEAKIKQILQHSLGRPGEAISLLKKPEELEDRKKKIKELKKISNSPLSTRFKYVENMAKQENVLDVLSLWLSHFRDLLLKEKKSRELLRLKDIIKSIQKTIYLISTTNTNKRLALEILIMNI